MGRAWVPEAKEVQEQASAGKVIATIFWDAKGVIMLEFLAKRSTITSVLCKFVRPAENRHPWKRRGKLSKGVLLQQDKVAMDAVERNGYELIPHPAYSPDLAPSDFFLFQT